MVSNHNGKEVKIVKGKNVRISDKSFDKIRKFVWGKGYRLGWFYEQAALEKMNNEIEKEKK